MNVLITPQLIELLRQYRLGTVPYKGQRWQEGEVLSVEPEARIEPYAHIFQGHSLPFRVGAFTYSYSIFDQWLSLGRYCSVAANVLIMGTNHPSHWASQSIFSYEPQQMGGMLEYMRDFKATPFALHPAEPAPLTVLGGHDVWIGGGAMIKRGIRIGTGAVIAARAVVTHDVPPYAIVAGVPAKILRYRFPDALIDRLLESEWWRFGPDVLQPLDVRDPEMFVDRVGELDAAGHKALSFRMLTGEEIIAAGEVVAS